MAIKKYLCEYCKKQFQDTPSDRKRHAASTQHKQAKARWYDSFKPQHHHHPIPQQQPNQPFCFHFVSKGFCRYGDSCKYFHPNTQQQQPITTTPPGNLGVSFGNLPPSLQPPPEGGYAYAPFVDWG